jgi:hypothetical protein
MRGFDMKASFLDGPKEGFYRLALAVSIQDLTGKGVGEHNQVIIFQALEGHTQVESAY